MRREILLIGSTFILTSALWVGSFHFFPRLEKELTTANELNLNPGTFFLGLASDSKKRAALDVQELDGDFGPVRQVLAHYEVPLNETRRFAMRFSPPSEWTPPRKIATRLLDLFRGDTYPSYVNNRFCDWELLIVSLSAVCLAALWFFRRKGSAPGAWPGSILICLVPFLTGLVIAIVEASLVLYPQVWIGPPQEGIALEATLCAHVGFYCTLALLFSVVGLTVFQRSAETSAIVEQAN
jgi:hypothetical protein